ncbi:MAG: hypothetical protein AAB402_03730 [Patescibacteria group bacterium]
MSNQPDTRSPDLLAGIPTEFTTVAGAANMIAKMAQIKALRPTAERWFQRYDLPVQLDLIRSLRQDSTSARELIYLVPDAKVFLTRLEVPFLRRLCDERGALIAELTPVQLLTLLRSVNNDEARLAWLTMICDAFQEHEDRFLDFLDGIEVAEVAAWYSVLIAEWDEELYVSAEQDPKTFEPYFHDGFEFLMALYECRPELYRQVVKNIMLDIRADHEATSFSQSEEEMRLTWSEYTDDLVATDDGQE